jgi:hypothetical protein
MFRRITISTAAATGALIGYHAGGTPGAGVGACILVMLTSILIDSQIGPPPGPPRTT